MNIKERIFYLATILCTITPLIFMFFLLIKTLVIGIGRINWAFILGYPSRFPAVAGILPSLMGSFYLLLLTFFIAFPLGLASAIYLEEYSKDSFLKRLIELNVSNLSSVPSVIFGILGLDIFVRKFNFGPTLIAGAFTLSLLILPIIITTTREALKIVPNTLREAAYSLGATRLLVTFKIVVPLSLPQVLTGIILAMARAIGESAPLIVLGVSVYVAFVPSGIFSEFSALPLQIFHWIERPQAGFKENAASGIVVLLLILIVFNGFIAYFRSYHENKRGHQ